MEAAKEEVAQLPPGAVVVTAMKFDQGTAQEQAHKLHYTCKCQAKNPYAECTGINIFILVSAKTFKPYLAFNFPRTADILNV